MSSVRFSDPPSGDGALRRTGSLIRSKRFLNARLRASLRASRVPVSLARGSLLGASAGPPKGTAPPLSMANRRGGGPGGVSPPRASPLRRRYRPSPLRGPSSSPIRRTSSHQVFALSRGPSWWDHRRAKLHRFTAGPNLAAHLPPRGLMPAIARGLRRCGNHAINVAASCR